MKKRSVIVVGAGPAGLIAAYRLSSKGVDVTVVEADPTYVGGISKTINYKGFLFDIGGHRFFSKSEKIVELWNEILPKDFLDRPRSSRIFYNGKFFSYPLKPLEAFRKLGLFESVRCVLSYFKRRVIPVRPVQSFQDWVTNRFGDRLFQIFFKTYTEKVWGLDCREISADWAAQRIKGLSLWAAAKSSFFKPSHGDATLKTLIDHFKYPRRGPGMMWDACSALVKANGGKVILGHRVSALHFDPKKNEWTVESKDQTGKTVSFKGTDVIYSGALGDIGKIVTPAPKARAASAAAQLRYRDFLIVAVIMKDRNLFADNWIYIHEPNVRVGRIQNYKSWSPEMVPNPEMNCYGMEYFCNEGDATWEMSDESLIRLAGQELEKLGLGHAKDIQDGCVVRQRKAYPVYDDTYKTHLAEIRAVFEKDYPNIHFVGRNGMHKYNNQDHSMMTGLLVAENILAGRRIFDPWLVNGDAEYHEEKSTKDDDTGRLTPMPTKTKKAA